MGSNLQLDLNFGEIKEGRTAHLKDAWWESQPLTWEMPHVLVIKVPVCSLSNVRRG